MTEKSSLTCKIRTKSRHLSKVYMRIRLILQVILLFKCKINMFKLTTCNISSTWPQMVETFNNQWLLVWTTASYQTKQYSNNHHRFRTNRLGIQTININSLITLIKSLILVLLRTLTQTSLTRMKGLDKEACSTTQWALTKAIHLSLEVVNSSSTKTRGDITLQTMQTKVIIKISMIILNRAYITSLISTVKAVILSTESQKMEWFYWDTTLWKTDEHPSSEKRFLRSNSLPWLTCLIFGVTSHSLPREWRSSSRCSITETYLTSPERSNSWITEWQTASFNSLVRHLITSALGSRSAKDSSALSRLYLFSGNSARAFYTSMKMAWFSEMFIQQESIYSKVQ